jgi:hypothetical protein
MELLVNLEILMPYIHGPTFGNAESRFYSLHNVSTLNQCRKFSCVTVVCKHFASYRGYPNYRWDLTLSLLISYIYMELLVKPFNVVYIWTYVWLQ